MLLNSKICIVISLKLNIHFTICLDFRYYFIINKNISLDILLAKDKLKIHFLYTIYTLTPPELRRIFKISKYIFSENYNFSFEAVEKLSTTKDYLQIFIMELNLYFNEKRT